MQGKMFVLFFCLKIIRLYDSCWPYDTFDVPHTYTQTHNYIHTHIQTDSHTHESCKLCTKPSTLL